MLWLKLSKSKRGDLKNTNKMAFGMILLGIGYLVLTLAVLKTGSSEADITVKANLLFIVITLYVPYNWRTILITNRSINGKCNCTC